jgi:hypothetical protein
LRDCFPIHEIGRIDGGRGFQTEKNVFGIGGNTFYDQKFKIPMKIPEFKGSGIGLIAEFCGILNGFLNQACRFKTGCLRGSLYSHGIAESSGMPESVISIYQ